MPVTLFGDCSLDVIEKRECEFLDGDVAFILREVRCGTSSEFGDESGIRHSGFGRAVCSEINGFAVDVDGGVEFFPDFDFAVLGRLMFDFGHFVLGCVVGFDLSNLL